MTADATPLLPLDFGLIIVGDEILSGRRTDKHLAKVIELLGARGMALAWADYVGDEPARITATLRRAFESGAAVLCTGGIGATPDDHTRQCAAAALGVPLALHPQARALIEERMRDVAAEQGTPYDPSRPDNLHRLNMGVFPAGARIIPNPYNKIAGFSCLPSAASANPAPGAWGPAVHFFPGFPVMAWPMMEWVLDQHYAQQAQLAPRRERSVIVFGGMEATLTPVMERVESVHPGVKVFSLPSVDHPQFGRHIDLGVKGPAAQADAAYADLRQWLQAFDLTYGPEIVRDN